MSENKTFEASLYDHAYWARTNKTSTACYEARDLHFNCLDARVKGLEAKHGACPETLDGWLASCSTVDRKRQMIARFYDKRREFLFSDRELRNYFD